MMEEPKQKTIPYYFLFEEYIDENFKIDGHYTIRFDTMIGKWFLYENGYYHKVPIQEIYLIFTKAMLTKGMDESTTKMNYCIKKLEAITQFNGEWDDNSSLIDNCISGIVDLKTHELDTHHPSYMFRHQVPRKYDPTISEEIPKLFDQVLKCIPNEKHRANFVNFFLHVIHKNFNDEVFMMLYGVKGAGKSTLIQIFTEIYGPEMTSKTGLHKLGGRFGKTDMYDKRVNCEPDLPIKDLKPYTISELKKLTGEDGYLEVEMKNRDPFKYLISCFLIFGINQLMGFDKDAEKEIDSVMRRAVLIQCPNVMPKDAKFKRKIRDPEFLDELYSWAVIKPHLPIYEAEEMEEWIRQNKEDWLLNSNPILRICKELYEYCATDEVISDEGVTIPLVRSLRVSEVVPEILENLDAEGHIIPQHTSVQSQITQALKTMKIYRNTRTGKNSAYENIVRRDSE